MSKKNDDASLDAFLKRHVPAAPPPPWGEKQRIWRAIEARESTSRRWLDLLRPVHLRLAVPVVAVAIVAGALHVRKVRHDTHVERVLAAALSYQLEEEDEMFY